MTFAHPWVLILAPFYLVLEVLLYYLIKSKSLSLPTVSFLKVYETWRTTTARLMRILPVSAAIFLIFALSGPQSVETTTQILPSGIDIMVAIDVSGSMAAEDFQPLNRLEMAKDVLRDFILGRPSDRIGLILFGGRSVTRSPLTIQHEPLLHALETVEMGTLPEGTAIGSAIMSGLNRLAGETREQKRDTKGERILLLITDGRNNAGEIHPRDALSIAVRQKIKIYTIGVGSSGTVPFPVFTPEGKKTYRYEKADLDEALLTEIAERTGGRYFRASDPRSMQILFDQINTLEKSEAQVLESRNVVSKSYPLAVPALFLSLCYALLTITIIRLP